MFDNQLEACCTSFLSNFSPNSFILSTEFPPLKALTRLENVPLTTVRVALFEIFQRGTAKAFLSTYFPLS